MKHPARGIVLLLIAASAATATALAAPPVRVVAVVAPLTDLVERVGGERVETETLVPSGANPHTFSPTPRDVLALSEARLYVGAAMPFEKRLTARIRSAFPKTRILDLSADLPTSATAHAAHESHDAHGAHDHGKDGDAGDSAQDPEHEHAHAGEMDPHIWLSPPLLKIEARRVTEALSQADPEGEGLYHKNLEAFLKDLDALDARLRETLAPYRGESFLVYHPAFGHFAAAYGLEQKAIETGGRNPGPRSLAAMIEKAKREKVRVIFVQPQFDPKSARTVASALGAAVIPIDPLGGDVLGNLQNVADALEKAFSEASSRGAERDGEAGG